MERVGLTAQQISHDIVAQVLGARVPHARPLPEETTAAAAQNQQQ